MEVVNSYTHFDRNISQFLSLHIFMAAQHFPFQYRYCVFHAFLLSGFRQKVSLWAQELLCCWAGLEPAPLRVCWLLWPKTEL